MVKRIIWTSISSKISLGDYFILCYFCHIRMFNALVGSLREDLGEVLGSWTHTNSTSRVAQGWTLHITYELTQV